VRIVPTISSAEEREEEAIVSALPITTVRPARSLPERIDLARPHADADSLGDAPTGTLCAADEDEEFEEDEDEDEELDDEELDDEDLDDDEDEDDEEEIDDEDLDYEWEEIDDEDDDDDDDDWDDDEDEDGEDDAPGAD
jgi:segregation and condensation protein B